MGIVKKLPRVALWSQLVAATVTCAVALVVALFFLDNPTQESWYVLAFCGIVGSASGLWAEEFHSRLFNKRVAPSDPDVIFMALCTCLALFVHLLLCPPFTFPELLEWSKNIPD
ncbi:hypothetical protein BH11PAT4_BH11PAT4_8310 [soil metagenome]